MKDVEKAVLRLLNEHDIWLSPNNIARNTGYSQGYIQKVAKSLFEDGYLRRADQAGDPFYKITDSGVDLLQKHGERAES